MKTVPDFYTGKKILITGANAYLGPKLADMLAQIDCQLVLHGHKDFKPVFSQSVAKIETLSGDLSQKDAWAKLLPGVDVIFHLAAHESRNFEPELDLALNAGSVLELLETCRAKQFSPKIVFASSANLVGLTDRLPVDETFADRPLTIYAIHKLTAERYLKYYAENYDIKSVILRLSNVYGPSVDLESFRRVAFNRMIAAAFGTGKLMLFRNRHCVRDYLYIDDAIAAFLAGGSSKKTGDGNFYVIGNEKGYNFGEFAKLIAEKVSAQTGRQVEIASDEITELVPAEFRNFVADSARFKKLTGWKTEISLGQGIEKTLSYLAKVS